MTRDGTPVVVRTRAELADLLSHGRDGRVALVPTMGALHAGHRALVEGARALLTDRDTVVVSIFVNPMQFGPGEDLDRYPRTFEEDLRMCAEAGADLVFAPGVEEVYPGGEPQVTVDPGEAGSRLEGQVRPGHFRGVLTVVAKLLGLVRRMVTDLCLAVEVAGVETVREPDGLALSSRNAYLSDEDRVEALFLSQALHVGAAAAVDGADHALAAARAVLRRTHKVDLDYLVLTDPELGPAPDLGEARLLVAARVGSTRLLDNVPVHVGRRATTPVPDPVATRDSQGAR